MRAARMHGYNERLQLEEIPVPDFGPDEVLVKVAAAGMCRSDFQLVEGVTGFTNGEEQAVGLTDVVPFLVEDELIRLGANYEKVADWEPYVVTDGLLITGQNPASSAQSAAETLLRQA
jgi:putative intracellular protease/amidase